MLFRSFVTLALASIAAAEYYGNSTIASQQLETTTLTSITKTTVTKPCPVCEEVTTTVTVPCQLSESVSEGQTVTVTLEAKETETVNCVGEDCQTTTVTLWEVETVPYPEATSESLVNVAFTPEETVAEETAVSTSVSVAEEASESDVVITLTKTLYTESLAPVVVTQTIAPPTESDITITKTLEKTTLPCESDEQCAVKTVQPEIVCDGITCDITITLLIDVYVTQHSNSLASYAPPQPTAVEDYAGAAAGNFPKVTLLGLFALGALVL